MERKTDQRKRDEAAMRYAGLLGHTFFEVADDGKGGSRLCAESSSIVSAQRHRVAGSRLYQRIAKGKYNLVG